MPAAVRTRYAYPMDILTAPAVWRADIDGWSAWLRAAGRPSSTIGLRRYHLRRVAVHFGDVPAWTLTVQQLAGYLAAHDWSPETRRSVRASLRSFYAWGRLVGLTEHDPAALLPTVTPPAGRPRPVPEDVLDAALDSADERVRLMLMLASRAGLRRGEIAGLHSRDLVSDLDGWSLRVTGKGARVRLVPLLDDVARELRQLPAGYVFPGADHGHLSPRWVGKLVSAALPEGWTCHTLRHRFASRTYAVGRDLRTVQELLGHAKPETTARYTAVPPGAMRQAVTAAA